MPHIDSAERKIYSDTGAEAPLAGLAKLIVSLDRASIPERVWTQAALTVLDITGCIAAGSQTPEARAIVRAEREASGAGGAPVFGSPERLSVVGAARVHAYMGDIHELNDLTCGHVGVGVVPAALALAETTNSTGAELLVAVTAGVEVACRVYSAFYPSIKPYDDVGMVSVGLVNAIGAAAASAKLLNLDLEATKHALACAASLAGWCPAEAVFGEGSSSKPFMFGGTPAGVGVHSALLAKHGVTGPTSILESPLGYFRSVAHSHNLDYIFDESSWYLASPARKLHACCGYIHSALDSILARRQEISSIKMISGIEVAVPGYIVPAISKNAPPRNANEARFHLPYCLALGITGIDTILPVHSEEFDRFMSDDVYRLMALTRIRPEPEFNHYHQSRVTIEFADGLQLSEYNSSPRGSSQNPLNDGQVIAKFVRLASTAIQNPGAYAERILELEDAPDVRWISGAGV